MIIKQNVNILSNSQNHKLDLLNENIDSIIIIY